jgi:hypothetical protein
MTTKHTNEPWQLLMVDGEHDETHRGIIFCQRPETDCCKANPRIALAIVDHIEGGEGEANASRIVSCVNACAGLNPESVPELLALAQHVLAMKGDCYLTGHPEWDELVAEAESALKTTED